MKSAHHRMDVIDSRYLLKVSDGINDPGVGAPADDDLPLPF